MFKNSLWCKFDDPKLILHGQMMSSLQHLCTSRSKVQSSSWTDLEAKLRQRQAANSSRCAMKRLFWGVVSYLTTGQPLMLQRSKFNEVKHQFLTPKFSFTNFWPVGLRGTVWTPLCSSGRDGSKAIQFNLKRSRSTFHWRSGEYKVDYVAYQSIWTDM